MTNPSAANTVERAGGADVRLSRATVAVSRSVVAVAGGEPGLEVWQGVAVPGQMAGFINHADVRSASGTPPR
jgi:hypothetical protein